MSRFTLLLSSHAEHDVNQAVDYYDSVSQGLGLEFINVIDKYFAQIQQVPTASAIQYDQVRVKPIKLFPFTIHYTLVDAQIIIIRVFNTHQRPLV